MIVLIYFSLGASLASFLGVVVDRFPEKSIVLPASHCDNCQTKLGISELIPILSQLYYASRCKHCGSSIPRRYLFLELVCGLLFVGLSYQLISLPLLISLLMSFTLALYDYDQQEYPIMVWLIFTLLLLPFAHDLGMFSVIGLFGILAHIFPLKIGSGDFFYLASLSLILDKMGILWIIQIGSWLAICYLLTQGHRRQPIAFVPFLTLGLVILLSFRLLF
ncbi:prepilin peptidase [Streptococcus sp. zg-JUN1979]|uniref:prepilin peptidase n=1 Tax=Streptococcus sp. zg-JUN1979 TaxID=3391450 RepID=UPI0039A73BF2